MSIALVVLSINGDKSKSIYMPIASEDVFDGVWMQGVNALKLSWVNLFDVGFDVDKNNIKEVNEELKLLSAWLASSSVSIDQAQMVIIRIDNIIKIFSDFIETGVDYSAFIG